MWRVVSRLLYPRERPGTYLIGHWVGPTTGLDGCGKSCPPFGFDPRTVQQIRTSLKDVSELVHPPLISRALEVKSRTLSTSWTAYNWRQFVTKLQSAAALEQESFHNYVCRYYSNFFALRKVNDLRHPYVVNWGVRSDICSLISCWVCSLICFESRTHSDACGHTSKLSSNCILNTFLSPTQMVNVL